MNARKGVTYAVLFLLGTTLVVYLSLLGLLARVIL
jgi:hypothetical protein